MKGAAAMIEAELWKDLPLFEDVPADRWEALSTAASLKRCEDNEVIFQQGDEPGHLYVVQSGTVDIVLRTDAENDAEDLVIASFEAGSYFGELAVFDRHARTATARAAGPASLICVPLDQFAALVETCPSATRSFVGTLINRIRHTDEMLARLNIRNLNEVADARMTVGERIADRVARFGGSWPFIISFGVFLLLWMAINTAWLLRTPPDPFPYIFLNLILSCLAALQAPVIMMSQNRQSTKDRLQADQDFAVNVKAEIAIQQLHRKIDELRSSMTQQQRHERAGRP